MMKTFGEIVQRRNWCSLRAGSPREKNEEKARRKARGEPARRLKLVVKDCSSFAIASDPP